MIKNARQLCVLFKGLCAWLLLLAVLGGGTAQARFTDIQDQPVAPFRIVEQGGELGTKFHYLGESQKIGGESLDFSNSSFEEYLLYRMKGYVYHPRLLEIDSSIKLGLLQQAIHNPGPGDGELAGGNSNTYLSAYSLYLTFLKEHPLSFSIFAHRERDAVMELFTDRIMTQTQDMGGSVNLKAGPFPMDLSASQSSFKEWGFDSTSDSKMKTLDYAVRNSLGKWMNTELRYHYQDYRQTFRADQGLFNLRQRTHLVSNDVNLLNTLYLDQARRSSLTSSLRLFDQTGTQDLKSTYLQERLNLQHSPNFRTYYLMSYLQNQLSGETIKNYRGEIGLDHKLYQSIESHLDLHWRENDFASASEVQYGPTGRLGYRKNTPWGVLGMGYSRTVDQVERTGNTGVRPIHQESLVMHDRQNNFLANPAVIESSIVVKSQDGLITYDEGFDYELLRQGNRLALRLLFGRRIKDGQTVLVDYDVDFTADMRFIYDDQDFNINYDFAKSLDGLSVYYRWHDLTPRNVPANDLSDLSVLAYNDQLTGFTYRWGRLTWREEYDVYQSNNNNYNQLLSQIEGLHEIGRRLRLGWHAGYQATNYTGLGQGLPPDQNYDNAVFAGATLRGSIRTNGYWETQVEARQETGQVDETLLGVLGKLGLRVRKLKIEAGGRAETRKLFNAQRDRYSLFLQLAREF